MSLDLIKYFGYNSHYLIALYKSYQIGLISIITRTIARSLPFCIVSDMLSVVRLCEDREVTVLTEPCRDIERGVV